MGPSLHRIREVIRNFIDREKNTDSHLLQLSKDLSENPPVRSIAVLKLDEKEIIQIFGLKISANKKHFTEIPPLHLPAGLGEQLSLVDETLNLSKSNEANIRWKLNLLLIVNTEHQWSQEGLMIHGKEVRLTGRPDYAIWYGEEDELAVNVILMEAKTTNLGFADIAQTLGYMSMVHRGGGGGGGERTGKKDCEVYGIACDDTWFAFMKINNTSKY
ncbi:hypothetical protein N7466_006972 [Penicillium verhagenii]|uniref:uncharacterized protein n=1 Tax=Penicillium verhagenii TaxID=1562060 RepID=UPI002545AB6D|nr:uncharacterized protein N7466_006972 [Penicillium verhagenii]KAJ5928016.1 hypothetical protein N7466_006972 [Penicillium verhagenii]